MDDHLEKFMQSGSISTWVLLQVDQIIGDGYVHADVHPATFCSRNQNCEASKECLGPIAKSLQLNQASQRLAEQISQAERSISVAARTLAELRYKQKKEEHKSLLEKQGRALENLSRVRFDVASQIGRSLTDDVIRSLADSRWILTTGTFLRSS